MLAASSQQAQGEEAVRIVLAWEGGSFEFVYGTGEVQGLHDRIHRSLETVLLDAFTRSTTGESGSRIDPKLVPRIATVSANTNVQVSGTRARPCGMWMGSYHRCFKGATVPFGLTLKLEVLSQHWIDAKTAW